MRVLIASTLALIASVVVLGCGMDTHMEKAEAAGGTTQNVLNFHCYSNQTANIDPFAPLLGITDFHDHVIYGNRALTQDVTEEELLGNTNSNCGPSWATNAMWRPTVSDGVKTLTNIRAKFYYREGIFAPSKISPLPPNAKMLGIREFFNCGGGTNRPTPPYGCTKDLRVKVLFPQCYDPNHPQGNVPDAYHYPTNGSCPSGNQKIPELTIDYIFGLDHALKSPLAISAGHDEVRDYTFMHADEWATYQPQFSQFIKDCVMKSTTATLPPKCKPEGNENL